jgi:hypothetical protein
MHEAEQAMDITGKTDHPDCANLTGAGCFTKTPMMKPEEGTSDKSQ